MPSIRKSFFYYSFGLAIHLLVFVSCQKDISTKNNSILGINDTIWLKKEIGYWIDYQIDSIRYIKDIADSQVKIVKSTHFERILFGDTIEGFSPKSYRLDIYQKSSITNNWTLREVDQFYYYSDEFVFSFQNIKRVLLHLPVLPNKSWNGNKYIAILDSSQNWYSNQTYSFGNSILPLSFQSFNFDSTIQISLKNEENAIEKKQETIIVAKGIGIISWETKNLEKQNILNNWDMPENGIWIKKSIIGWKE